MRSSFETIDFFRVELIFLRNMRIFKKKSAMNMTKSIFQNLMGSIFLRLYGGIYMARKSGVLMHVTSLYGDYGIGSLGRSAFEFIDFLFECGFSYWQTLPLCMTDEHNSPYKSYSSFAANPYLIDLPTLRTRGLITNAELESARQQAPYLCEFKRLKSERLTLLGNAAARAMKLSEERNAVEEFINSEPRLLTACNFLALKEKNKNAPWQKFYHTVPDKNTLFKWKFIQYEFFAEWQKIKAYANEKGISIIGDLPIYVALDSADVWSAPEQFLLDTSGYPTAVAGVPPDCFSKDGQLWGNPIYNYKQMKSDSYSFWRARVEHAFKLFDAVRIDHFRAFESYWKIPIGESAKIGSWVRGPGRALINAIRESARGKSIIAEDLGEITPKVDALRRYSAFPGMRVLQFAFVGDENSPHLPHNFEKNCVVYTGTHDNNTLFGYIMELDNATRERVFDYFGYNGGDPREACRHINRALLASVADTVIFPIQDLLIYGSDTRMNTPGNADGNWVYRLTRNQLYEIDRKQYRRLNTLYGRCET